MGVVVFLIKRAHDNPVINARTTSVLLITSLRRGIVARARVILGSEGLVRAPPECELTRATARSEGGHMASHQNYYKR